MKVLKCFGCDTMVGEIVRGRTKKNSVHYCEKCHKKLTKSQDFMGKVSKTINEMTEIITKKGGTNVGQD